MSFPIKVTRLVSQELLEDERLFVETVRNQITASLSHYFEVDFILSEWDILEGEGSYERFIFGGAPGL